MPTSRTVASGSLPMRLYTRGTEPEFTGSFTYHSGLENLPVLKNLIPLDELDLIRNGPLGVLLRFYESRFLWSARIVHDLLVNQLVTKKKYEFWTLCGGQAIRFSLKEFEKITGLNCEAYPPDNMKAEVDLQFRSRLGLTKEKEPSYSMVAEQIMNCKHWDNKEDRIRLVHLFLVFRLLLARHPGTGIASEAAFLVDREKFEAFPWRRVAFEHLIDSIFEATPDLSNNSYGVNGFVQILQVWAYEAIPAIGKTCGQPRVDMMEFPPLLRWKGSRKRCTYDLPQKREPVDFFDIFIYS